MDSQPRRKIAKLSHALLFRDLHTAPDSTPPPQPISSHRELIISYMWLIGRNVVGWLLILTSFIAGPFIPGPGGIPMFLIGFALVSFPGKRHLTARILRGRVFHFWSLRMLLITIAWAVALPGLLLMIFGSRWERLEEVYRQGPLAILSLYVAGVVAAWLIALIGLRAGNLLVRFMPHVRRRVRPWLRKHHIHLLPPRWRRRNPNEAGRDRRVRLKDEVLAYIRHRREQKRG